MNERLTLMLAWVAGLLLGGISSADFWWTVRKGVSSKQPVLWFVGSLWLRMTIALAGFYFCRARVLGAASGMSARICHRAPDRDMADTVAGKNPNYPTQEAGHAP